MKEIINIKTRKKSVKCISSKIINFRTTSNTEIKKKGDNNNMRRIDRSSMDENLRQRD